MNTVWLLLTGRTTGLFTIFRVVMVCILLVFLATASHFVCIFHELFMASIRFHSVLPQKAQSNSHPDKAPFSLNTVIFMCLSHQTAESSITISLSFHNSQELGVSLSCRLPLRVVILE